MHRVEPMNEHSDTDDPNGDGEGVWSPDIEYYFHEALTMFPPCGRRKHILPEEGGKMFGRNELIARHIFANTGKIRTRKQVSSHIQVLARRKAKAESTSNGGGSTAGSVSPASSMGVGGEPNNRLGRPDSAAGGHTGPQLGQQPAHHHYHNNHLHQGNARLQYQPQDTAISLFHDAWNNRPIVTHKIRLVEFSAFIEYRPVASTAGPGSLFARHSATLTGPSPDPASAPNGALGQVQPSPHLGPTGAAQGPAFGVAGHTPNGSDTTPQSPHPLAASQHLQVQFNYHQNQPLADHHHQHLHHHHHNHPPSDLMSASLPVQANGLQLQHHQLQSSTGFKRHSYIKIDYRQPMSAHATKLERIDIGQVQDKFPEIGGPEGLFQRGPSDAFFLVKFWADLSSDHEYNLEDQNSYFGFSSHFETMDPYKDITCSTKACSYGHQVVEKVEKIYGAFNNLNGRYSYDIDRSPMCEFMIQFIKKLRQLPMTSQMNSVLENFTVLQVVSSESTSEILLCLAYVFEIAAPERTRGGSQYHVYKLTKD